MFICEPFLSELKLQTTSSIQRLRVLSVQRVGYVLNLIPSLNRLTNLKRILYQKLQVLLVCAPDARFGQIAPMSISQNLDLEVVVEAKFQNMVLTLSPIY